MAIIARGDTIGAECTGLVRGGLAFAAPAEDVLYGGGPYHGARSRAHAALDHAAMAGWKCPRLLLWLRTAGLAGAGRQRPVETVPEPEPGETLEIENGVLGRAALLQQVRAALLQQVRAARQAIKHHRPDRIVTLGGDCLIDLAPMAYLNTRYGGNLSVLWVDLRQLPLLAGESA